MPIFNDRLKYSTVNKDIMSFWKAALKYHAPATISGFVFFYLASTILGSENLLLKHPVLAVAILVIIANFCAFLLYRSTATLPTSATSKINISENKISENEVDGSLKISADTVTGMADEVSIKKNEILGNRVKGDMVIGANKNDVR